MSETEDVSLMSGTVPLIFVSLAVEGVVEDGTAGGEFTRAASVLVDEVEGADFLSLAEVEGSSVAEMASLKVAGAGVIVDDLVEATTLLSDELETGVATAAGVDVGPFEVAVEVAEVVEEVVEVDEAGLTFMALVAEDLDLVMVKEI